MMSLLALCLTLNPMRIDETVYLHLREKFLEKLPKPLLWVGYVIEDIIDHRCCSMILFLDQTERYHSERFSHTVKSS
jgi:RNA polymerase I-associated factor PAF67